MTQSNYKSIPIPPIKMDPYHEPESYANVLITSGFLGALKVYSKSLKK